MVGGQTSNIMVRGWGLTVAIRFYNGSKNDFHIFDNER